MNLLPWSELELELEAAIVKVQVLDELKQRRFLTC